MDIKYTVESVFKINFFKIKCINFKQKKKAIEKVLKKYPEMPFSNFYSNKNKANITRDLQNIFKDEFMIINLQYNRKIKLNTAWSVTYKKGDYHIPHNHGSKGYTGILYLNMHKDSPRTTYIQPWNNENDRTVLYKPPVEEGDIVIVPQFLLHYTEPNLISFKKRIISFDF
jgi:hypothetical protein|tara:strand:- start:44 stop:556 length:513 start_codon:yes stop_codon:yes gene_type:complete